ncbi:AEC family transporter [Agrobacterium vitis]|uniref:AEC family transporter n=2 Tax=Agrobacterium vitis TaxID=373 RepID=A0AAE4WI86_AGRVI|nr:AEC family transporter [Allorhizobium sp. Av2]MUZ60393.1 AEC family transporter [Agrobacterium vitis]MUZ64047.1 AEC family transporter [Agrobacterium vitis]MVA19820.1 AEC family transporter [Agrobacterium vitis]MVA68370.1 AEC family transporter [Agrobacterium vitis]
MPEFMRVLTILTALIPIFTLILMGFILHRRTLLASEFWMPCERLNYFYLFPALMFSQIVTADLAGISLSLVTIALLGGIVLGGSIVFLLQVLFPRPGPVFSSVLQGALRPNTYVAVAAATALYGQPGLMVTAVAIAITIPVLNVGSIFILMIHGDNGPVGKRHMVKTIVTNPVILSVVIGGVVNLASIPMPDFVTAILKILGSASLPLGLLSVGAGIDFAAVRASRGMIWLSSAIKLAVLPVATYGIGKSLGLTGTSLATIILFNSLPCTPSTYIMARLFGGDYRMAASIISIQTAIAAVTIPLVLAALV